jgi:predicted nicotinamide N-methyase
MTEVRGKPLVAELERRFVVAHSRVPLPGGNVDIMHPESTDALISEEDMVRDDRLPYWADIWPSSRILARALAREAGAGRTLLELGAGLGLVSIGAMRAGYDVLASDYYDDALLFTRANAWRALKREPRTRMIDWRDLPADLQIADRVVAADVLYEDRYPPLVANVIARTLAPGGVATIADPGRPMVEQIYELHPQHALRQRNTETIEYDESPAKQTIRLHNIVR